MIYVLKCIAINDIYILYLSLKQLDNVDIKTFVLDDNISIIKDTEIVDILGISIKNYKTKSKL